MESNLSEIESLKRRIKNYEEEGKSCLNGNCYTCFYSNIPKSLCTWYKYTERKPGMIDSHSSDLYRLRKLTITTMLKEIYEIPTL